MYIRLMTHIPDYLVLRGVEDLVQSDGQLHHTQVGSQMSAGFGHVFDEKISDRIRQKLHLLQRHGLQILGKIVFCNILAHCCDLFFYVSALLLSLSMTMSQLQNQISEKFSVVIIICDRTDRIVCQLRKTPVSIVDAVDRGISVFVLLLI